MKSEYSQPFIAEIRRWLEYDPEEKKSAFHRMLITSSLFDYGDSADSKNKDLMTKENLKDDDRSVNEEIL